MIQRVAYIAEYIAIITGIIVLLILSVSVPVLLWIIAVALENLR